MLGLGLIARGIGLGEAPEPEGDSEINREPHESREVHGNRWIEEKGDCDQPDCSLGTTGLKHEDREQSDTRDEQPEQCVEPVRPNRNDREN